MPEMMEGKFKQVYEIDGLDLDEFIQEHYGRDPEMGASNEWNNYSHYQFGPFTKELDTTSKWNMSSFNRWDNWVAGTEAIPPSAHTILAILVHDGYLPVNMVIDVKVYW